jgi:aconitate hydratase 2/2-methylisocitrate dehydratase
MRSVNLAEAKVGLFALLDAVEAREEAFLLELLSERVLSGVDEAAYVKACWLAAIARGSATSPLLSPVAATHLLATMIGGYNVGALIELLASPDAAVAAAAAEGLSRTVLVYDAFHDVMERAATNPLAQQVVESWAAGEWFTSRPELPAEITVTVFKVEGETNTDDLSPATHATTRPDIPLHAQAMLETRRPGGLAQIAELKAKGHPVAYVDDVITIQPGAGTIERAAGEPGADEIVARFTLRPSTIAAEVCAQLGLPQQKPAPRSAAQGTHGTRTGPAPLDN